MNKNIWRKVSLLFLGGTIYLMVYHSDKVTEIVISSGIWAPVISFILFLIFSITPITTEPIIGILALTYSPYVAFVIGTLGNFFAMLIEYYFGKKLAHIFDYDVHKKKLPKIIQKLKVDSPLFLIFGRMIPGYGSKVISLIAGAEKVNMKTYLWTSVLSAIFGAAVISFSLYTLFK